VFPPSDWFDREDWQAHGSWWMIVDNKKVGCCAFESNVDFQEDVRKKPPRLASLYVGSTAISDGTGKRQLTDSHWEDSMSCFVPKGRAELAMSQ